MTTEHIEQYKKEGMFVRRGFLGLGMVGAFRMAFDRMLHRKRETNPGLEHPTFIPNSSEGWKLGEIRAVGRDLIGPNAKLLGEKFVIKWPTKENDRPYVHFWHQDSAYIGAAHPPYLTCLIALDKSTVENAALSVIPFSEFEPPGILNHINKGKIDEFQNSDSLAVSYGGEVYPGEKFHAKHVVDLDPGDMLVFSSLNLHGSGMNMTDKIRRSYLVHFSNGPVLNKAGELFWRAEDLR